MALEELIQLITNNGLSVICVGYLIYYQHTVMREMLEALNLISDRLTKIETKLEEHVHEAKQAKD